MLSTIFLYFSTDIDLCTVSFPFTVTNRVRASKGIGKSQGPSQVNVNLVVCPGSSLSLFPHPTFQELKCCQEHHLPVLAGQRRVARARSSHFACVVQQCSPLSWCSAL